MEDFAFLDDPFLVDGIAEPARPFGWNPVADPLGSGPQAYGSLQQNTFNKDYVSKTPSLVTRPAGFIQGFTDPFENQGSLEDEWMDLSSLLPDLEATATEASRVFTDPIPHLGLETLDFVNTLPTIADPQVFKAEQPQGKPVSFLERLLLQQNNLLGQKVKIESSESLWKWLSEQKDQTESPSPKESSKLLQEQSGVGGPQNARDEPSVSAYQSPEVQVTSQCDLSGDEDEGSDVDLEVLLDGNAVQLVQTSPAATEDIEATLSSAVSSPSNTSQGTDSLSAGCSTSDVCTMVYDEHTSPSASTSTPTPSTNPMRTRARSRRQTPSVDKMPSPMEMEWMNKTDRKKFQNKVAAIRYRMKKKVESDHKMTEVGQLESINKKLLEKVDKLSKEVTYMKNFFNDVRKARGLSTVKF